MKTKLTIIAAIVLFATYAYSSMSFQNMLKAYNSGKRAPNPTEFNDTQDERAYLDYFIRDNLKVLKKCIPGYKFNMRSMILNEKFAFNQLRNITKRQYKKASAYFENMPMFLYSNVLVQYRKQNKIKVSY